MVLHAASRMQDPHNMLLQEGMIHRSMCVCVMYSDSHLKYLVLVRMRSQLGLNVPYVRSKFLHESLATPD